MLHLSLSTKTLFKTNQLLFGIFVPQSIPEIFEEIKSLAFISVLPTLPSLQILLPREILLILFPRPRYIFQ